MAQIAVTLTLTIGGLLLLRSMQARAAVPLGFRTSDVLAFSVDPGIGVKGATNDEDITFFRTLLDEVRRTPGISSAGLAWIEPFKPIGGGGAMRPADNAVRARDLFDTNTSSSGFFDAIGLPILSGRDFTPSEIFRSDAHGGGVVIINAALARAVFGSEAVRRPTRADVVSRRTHPRNRRRRRERADTKPDGRCAAAYTTSRSVRRS